MTMMADLSSPDRDDLIPTAIVIKNIPFSVKREELMNYFSMINVPLPCAFNYHLDNGVFRGLAFANYRVPEEADMVIEMVNGMNIGGRKLRVEKKRVLPNTAGKDMGSNGYQGHRGNWSAETANPMRQRHEEEYMGVNDAALQQFRNYLQDFKHDPSRNELALPSAFASDQDIYYIGQFARKMGLMFSYQENGPDRLLLFAKRPKGTRPNGAAKAPKPTQANPSHPPYHANTNHTAKPSVSEPVNRRVPLAISRSDGSITRPVRQPRGPDIDNNFAERRHMRPEPTREDMNCQRLAYVHA